MLSIFFLFLQHEALNESPIEHDQSPEVTSKIVAIPEDINDMSFVNAQSPEVTSHATDNVNDGLTDEGVNGAMINISKDRDVPDGLRNMSEKLSAALVNVSAKEDLVKQHAKVAEEAISGTCIFNDQYLPLYSSLGVLCVAKLVSNLNNSSVKQAYYHVISPLLFLEHSHTQ